MSDLSDKSILFRGKKYILVKDRIVFFNENYPNGCIQTELLTPPESKIVIIKAKVWPDVKCQERCFIDYSQAKWGEGYINKAAAIENASTSAVGRALAYVGIGIIDSIASADEIHKATIALEQKNSEGFESTISEEQAADIAMLCGSKELPCKQQEYIAKITGYYKVKDLTEINENQYGVIMDKIEKLPDRKDLKNGKA